MSNGNRLFDPSMFKIDPSLGPDEIAFETRGVRHVFNVVTRERVREEPVKPADGSCEPADASGSAPVPIGTGEPADRLLAGLPPFVPTEQTARWLAPLFDTARIPPDPPVVKYRPLEIRAPRAELIEHGLRDGDRLFGAAIRESVRLEEPVRGLEGYDRWLHADVLPAFRLTDEEKIERDRLVFGNAFFVEEPDGTKVHLPYAEGVALLRRAGKTFEDFKPKPIALSISISVKPEDDETEPPADTCPDCFDESAGLSNGWKNANGFVGEECPTCEGTGKVKP